MTKDLLIVRYILSQLPDKSFLIAQSDCSLKRYTNIRVLDPSLMHVYEKKFNQLELIACGVRQVVGTISWVSPIGIACLMNEPDIVQDLVSRCGNDCVKSKSLSVFTCCILSGSNMCFNILSQFVVDDSMFANSLIRVQGNFLLLV